ncbi:protein-methionine sulfoxide oxidase mical3a isoform X2 [Eupeodes corollae]|nr:protein-methionine sulfoxide oxidase mical3a isoform X2 [Eupeodes corollae]XP_055912144.1 protein-methionine sulfoxide oxidase mical3a isoform X2 [Eupeodes corollae]
MAHVVGVPKRDPCQKCGLPVFLAERLTVGKRVYHRTCLKCARCSFQLTPGSFYETEVDGEYCCETCPDEEPSLEVESADILRNPTAAGADLNIAARPKSRIADRLAFFERTKAEESAAISSSSSKVLQKSLSDEEKSKSLKKISGEAAASASPYKMNTALSNFMNSTLDDEIDAGEVETNDNSLNSGQMDTSESIDISSDSEDDESEEKPPELPKSLPPDEDKISTLPREQVSENDQMKPLKSEMSIQLMQKLEEPLTMKNEITLETGDASLDEDAQRNDDHAEVEESLSITSIKITRPADDLNLSKSNFVTKDNTEPDEQMRTTNATIVVKPPTLPPPKDEKEKPKESIAKGPAEVVVDDKKRIEKELEEDKSILRQRPVTLDIKTNCNSDMTAAHEDEETANRLSVVRARLHQFEVIANNKNPNDNVMNKTPENTSRINSSSIKSDSIKSIVSEQQHSKDEEEMAKETISPTSEANSSVDVVVKEEIKHMESDEVPKIDEKVEEIKEIEISVTTEEITEKLEKNEDEAVSQAKIDTTIEASPEDSQDASLKKVIPVGIEVDNDEDEKIKKKVAIEEEKKPNQEIEKPPKPFTSPAKVNLELYPEELNPFKSDDEDEDIAPLPVVTPVKPVTPLPRKSLQQSPATTSAKKEDKDRSLNPFDSSDDEVEMEKKVKPPRPPPPKISKNPFGSESDDVGDENCSKSGNIDKQYPVPKPRTTLSQSQNQTPEATPRLSGKHSTSNQHVSPLNNLDDFYGSNSSLGSTPYSLQRNSGVRGSNISLTSSTGTIRSRKQHRAPAPPLPVKELFPSTETLDSKKSSPSSSNSATPNQRRKKRPAPAPPKPARLLDPAVVLTSKVDQLTGSKNSLNYPLQSDLDKLSDEEKALLEGNRLAHDASDEEKHHHQSDEYIEPKNIVQKLIPLDISLLADANDSLVKQKEEDNVVYRRTIIPKNIVTTPTHDESPIVVSHDRQLEKMKDNKEAQNRNRQSQVSSGAEDTDPLYNKSSHGKWKRRKGPAPALPIPQRKVLQMLPLQEIRHELDIIEVQQQGLEKQGVILEKMIRDRCEGKNGELNAGAEETTDSSGHPQNSKEVEDLILQLFELVNEKNELFRRQAELMYLRRQHRLEQEQADLEYEIRVLMAQPERNKTDTDKAREEALIARMVEVVQLRNEVVECLEMDRLREAEEDLSIKQRLELHSAKREEESNRNTLSKLSKKEKKKQKESKKFGKSKKLDADKDADESELGTEKQKPKKKKKKFLF